MLVNKLLKGSVKTLAFLTRTSIIINRRFSDNTSIKQPRKVYSAYLPFLGKNEKRFFYAKRKSKKNY